MASSLKVLKAMLEADRVAVCKPRYVHQSDRHDGQEVALPTMHRRLPRATRPTAVSLSRCSWGCPPARMRGAWNHSVLTSSPEARASPVVCSDSCGTKGYIRPGENGFVFRTDDIDHLEACLDKIVRDRKKLVEMGHRSYQLVVSEHAPERYVESLVAIASSQR